MIYASRDDYLLHFSTVPESFDTLAAMASSSIDTLTHCRINAIGFDNLTDYQRRIVTECTCELIQFLHENEDVLSGVLSAYAINGVSMQFQFNGTVYSRNGVTLRKSTYHKLLTTGLCYAGGLT